MRAPVSRVKVVTLGVLVLLLIMAVALPTLVVFVITMLPSAVAWLVDRTDSKYAGLSVLGLNFAGMFPYMMDLWSGNHTMTGAFVIITDIFALVVIYGAAGVGWVIFMVVPPVVTSFMTILTEQRLEALRANQKRTIDEWGQEVAVKGDDLMAGGAGVETTGAAPVPDGGTGKNDTPTPVT